MTLEDKLAQAKTCYNYGRMGIDVGIGLTAMTTGIIAVQLGAKDDGYLIKGVEAVMMYAANDFVDRYRENDRLYLTWGPY